MDGHSSAAVSKHREPFTQMEARNIPLRNLQNKPQIVTKSLVSMPDESAPSKKFEPRRDIKLDKTRPSMADESAQQSVHRSGLINKTLANIPKKDLIEQKESPQKGRRSVSCDSSSPSFMPEISELNACSFKSDQASIADWLELFEKNEDGLVNGESDENFFKIINKDMLLPLQCQTTPVEIAAMDEDDSRLGELDQAFIHEHSEINMQGPTLLEEAEIE